MSRIWITSDWHFSHDKDFLYTPRGFVDIETHNKTLIENHNSVVEDDDDVYVLGDLMLGDQEKGLECIRQLKGKLHIIRGNHCTDTKWEKYKELPNVVELVGWATMIKYKKYHFYLCHYPTCVSNGNDPVKVWCLCGHTHTKEKFLDIEKKCYHVEIDAHNNYPILLDNIIEDIKFVFY